MVAHYRTQGVVFKKEDRLEADRIFSVFTKDFGRVQVVGKAIRKINSKLRAGMGIFSLSEIEFIQGKNKKTLTDAISIKKFSGFASHPEKLLLAQKVSEVVDSFVKGPEQDERIFNLLNEAFGLLQGVNLPKLELVYQYFFWNFVSVLGYEPELFNCAHCHEKLTPRDLYFSNSEGGITCKNCSISKKGVLPVNADMVKVLRLMVKKDWKTLSKLKLTTGSQALLKEITENHYLYLKSNLHH